MNKNYYTKAKDINTIYRELKDNCVKRVIYIKKQKELWSYIHVTHNNCSNQMKAINKKIGYYTHAINGLISELCKYNKTHKAMNIAYDYIVKEIKRAENIIARNEDTIYRTKLGLITLVCDDGKRTNDYYPLVTYVNQKKDMVSKLRKWLNHVSRYRV